MATQTLAAPPAKEASAPIRTASLTERAPSFINEFGSITQLDANDLPILERLSIRRLLLAPRGVREPHWHANADELAYCLRGEHLVTIARTHSARESFTISPGEMFFVPSGDLHHVENIGSDEGEIIFGFSHERVEDFGLSGVFGCYTDAVLGNTVQLPAAAFAGLKRTSRDTVIGGRKTAAVVESQARHINPYKYPVEAVQPPVNSPAGSVHTAQTRVWPILKNISMFSLLLTEQGMRELHWHPETAEMGYVTKGHGRMTVVNPGGVADTYELRPGNVYFIPRSYPHHTEDLGGGDLHAVIFFDQPAPPDIGGKSLVSAFSPEVLAATFNVDPSALPRFPFTARDPLIVPRVNPIDPGRRS